MQETALQLVKRRITDILILPDLLYLLQVNFQTLETSFVPNGRRQRGAATAATPQDLAGVMRGRAELPLRRTGTKQEEGATE